MEIVLDSTTFLDEGNAFYDLVVKYPESLTSDYILLDAERKIFFPLTWQGIGNIGVSIKPSHDSFGFTEYKFSFGADGNCNAIERLKESTNIINDFLLERISSSSKKINHYATHISSEICSRVSPLVYNKVREAFYAFNQPKDLADILDLVAKGLEDCVKEYE